MNIYKKGLLEKENGNNDKFNINSTNMKKCTKCGYECGFYNDVNQEPVAGFSINGTDFCPMCISELFKDACGTMEFNN